MPDVSTRQYGTSTAIDYSTATVDATSTTCTRPPIIDGTHTTSIRVVYYSTRVYHDVFVTTSGVNLHDHIDLTILSVLWDFTCCRTW